MEFVIIMMGDIGSLKLTKGEMLFVNLLMSASRNRHENSVLFPRRGELLFVNLLIAFHHVVNNIDF